MISSKLQQNLNSILFHFRFNRLAFLCRHNANISNDLGTRISTQLSRHTLQVFYFTSSSRLSLRKLGDDEENYYPFAAAAIRRFSYIDNFVCSFTCFEDTRALIS